MEILNIENLTFRYPESNNNALDGISLSVKKGDFVLLCGASGSGKTTLLRLLKEDIAPFGEKSGNITYKNNTAISIVTQDAENQIVSDTVWHNLAFGLESENMPSYEIRQKVAEITEFFDMAHLFKKNTFSLSGGEKQLLNLASVLVCDPDILLLDEPTAQLDPIASKRFTDMIKRLNEEIGITIIISEHSSEDLWDFADTVCILDKGKTEYCGNPRNVADIDKLFEFVRMPEGMKLYNALKAGDKYPVTASECRKYLADNFKLNVDYIEEISSDKKTALEIKNIYFRYEKHGADILNKLNLKCNFGEILTLLGGNGSGKTTLLSLISGINKPYYGHITSHARKVCVLPQNVKSIFTKDVLSKDLALITDDYHDICRELAIEHLLQRNPYDLSGGEAQRAALAKILLLRPDVLCLDEPTKGIDIKGKSDIKKTLKNLANREVCVIIVSHDADFTAEVSDRCAFLFDGEIVSVGTPREMFSKNKFYTTFASKISRHMYKNTVTIEDIIQLCKRNGHY